MILVSMVFLSPAVDAVSGQDQLKSIKRIWRVGAKIQTTGPVTSLLVTFPVPTDWPEQHVNLYDEEIPDQARKADYRVLKDGVKQMVATFSRIPPRKQVDIHVLMEITVNEIPYPERTDQLVIPERVPSDMRIYLKPSPKINHRKINIKRQVNEIVTNTPSESAWEQIRGFYDWIGDNIELKKGEVIGAVATIKGKAGSYEDLSNLFIAMCRAHKVPARMVWADNGEYAEFYLVDDNEEGRWYPCVLTGKREFGSMTDPRVIIQKGDNIKVPELPQRQRFVVEHVSGERTGTPPRCQFIRDVLPARDTRGKR